MIRHNRKLNRLREHDYTQGGYYFVTICTDKRIRYFGKVAENSMILNNIGLVIKNQWNWLAEQYKYINLDEFVIMPDHLHAIIFINRVGTGRDLSLQKIKSLSGMVGAFKTTSSKAIHGIGLLNFKWQRSFYDHFIRKDESLENMRRYIINNPLNWEKDRNNFENLYI